jgi:ATP-dependent Lon protease
VKLKPIVVEGNTTQLSFKKMVEKITGTAAGTNNNTANTTTNQNNKENNETQISSSLIDDRKTQPNAPSFLNWPVAVYPKSFVQTILKLKLNGENYVALSLSRNKTVSKLEDVHEVGVLALIEVGPTDKSGSVDLTLKILKRIKVVEITKQAPPDSGYLRVNVQTLQEHLPAVYDEDACRNKAAKILIVLQEIQKVKKQINDK